MDSHPPSSALPRRPPVSTELRATHETEQLASRRRILETGRDRFFAEGFSSITMDELARELGMSKKTVYQYFASKHELLEAILEARVAEIHRQIQVLLHDPALDFFAKLTGLSKLFAQKLGEMKPVFFRDLKRFAPESFRRVEDFRRRAIPSLFGGLFEEGRREGMVCREIPSSILIELVLNLVQTTMTPETFARLDVSASETMAAIIHLIFEGVLTPRGRQEQRKRTPRSPSPRL